MFLCSFLLLSANFHLSICKEVHSYVDFSENNTCYLFIWKLQQMQRAQYYFDKGNCHHY